MYLHQRGKRVQASKAQQFARKDIRGLCIFVLSEPSLTVRRYREQFMIEYLALFSIALYFFGGILREKGAGKIKELALYSFRPPAPAMKNKRASSS